MTISEMQYHGLVEVGITMFLSNFWTEAVQESIQKTSMDGRL
ncbi:hypothetical protein FOPG_18242 [Fusarium oxysporum f. sp. conglutinans race 2 54008]|uniref:Uncharacterized protein n=1 Tax=Fusarium oxysporum f. sp. conglutinans race 2 54008 TaxID=1089457 RepID=X0H0B0_FUSOX|nr:hypothetical protein FOPG_18242 [Fusarium oxysporum f. sp. conglutinans race 2 54008]